jgi:hypothetical protein
MPIELTEHFLTVKGKLAAYKDLYRYFVHSNVIENNKMSHQEIWLPK